MVSQDKPMSSSKWTFCYLFLFLCLLDLTTDRMDGGYRGVCAPFIRTFSADFRHRGIHKIPGRSMSFHVNDPRSKCQSKRKD